MKAEQFIHPLIIEVSTEIHPSESESKIHVAIDNLVCPLEAAVEDGKPTTFHGCSADSKSLLPIYEGIRKRQILGVVRRLLIQNRSEDSTWLHFNKQAAYIDVIAVCDDAEESALGPILVRFNCRNLDAFIDWLAPKINHLH